MKTLLNVHYVIRVFVQVCRTVIVKLYGLPVSESSGADSIK